MARTKQTARKVRAPRKTKTKSTWEFNDHRGIPYTVLTTGSLQCYTHSNIQKLGLQLYSLSKLKPNKEMVGNHLLNLHVWGKDLLPVPRVDVYPAFGSIEECMEHHRREKEFRKQAAREMRENAIAGLDEIATEIALSIKIRGREPLPHIVPTYCCSAPYWSVQRAGESRHRSCILVIPKECHSWGDIIEKGLLSVEFDQDLTPEMETDQHECDPEEDTELPSEDGWVEVELFRYPGPVHIRRVCVRNPCQYEDVMAVDDEVFGVRQTRGLTPGCEIEFERFWERLIGQLPDYHAYRDQVVCENGPDEACERDMDEHVVDEDGQCVACRRELEYRRRSKRIANRVSKLGG